MDDLLGRIAEWERDGLIDPPTAARLRVAETARAAGAGDAGEPVASVVPAAPATASLDLVTAASEAPAETPAREHLTVASVFGPGVTVAEMFGYLGAGFLLGAWTAFVARLAGSAANTDRLGGGLLITAAGLILLAIVLGTADRRRRRAAGVALLVALGYVAVGLAAVVARWSPDSVQLALLVATGTLVAAAAFRRLLPALLTTVGLLASITAFGWAVLAVAQRIVLPEPIDGFGGSDESPPNELPLIILLAVGWLLVALVLGFLAIAEERAAPDPAEDPERNSAARRRATLIRAWAGLVAVWGLASAVTRSTFTADFELTRVIPAWLGDIAILVLAIILVERAFRRDSGAFLFAAGVGFVTALSDFNLSYLSETRELGLLIEGGILLGVGVVADRLRRRMPGGRADRPGPSRVDASPARIDVGAVTDL